jgi:erythromycin esterase-like protein
MLQRLQQQDWDTLAQGKLSANDAFYIEQNARVVKNAEAYYRSLFINEVNNWNLRDSHMMQTIQEIIKHHQLKGVVTPKIIIWAHNSHVGNAAATQMADHGEYNIGQLVKEQFGKRAVSVGFTTYTGTVSAASNWHAPVERKVVRAALPESYEAFFHATDISQFLLQLNSSLVPSRLLERAIGVVYHPSTERVSHYFYADLARQFDWLIHCDTTHALVPLDKTAQWLQGEVPETYPSGL